MNTEKKKIINEVEIVKVGQRILGLNDERVKKYREGEFSQIDFIRSITKKDPFYIMNGSLSIVTDIDKVSIENNRKKVQKIIQIEQGEIDCKKLYENREVLLEVYPELTSIVKKVDDSFNSNPNSNKCGVTRRTNPILMKLLQIKYDGRDLKPLKAFIAPNGIKRLKDLKDKIKFSGSKLNKDIIYKRFCK
jgi:hypothetical protein